MRTQSRQFTVALLTIALLVGVLSFCPALAAGQSSTQSISLSARSADNQHPAIACSPDGQRLFVSWDGLVNGRRRVYLRERVNGYWLPEAIIDTEPEAENCSPVLDVDAAGNPHVAWLGKVSGKYRVFYAFRLAGTWNHWGVLRGEEKPEDNCEAVALKIDQENAPWIAWQAGSASVYSIYCAHLNGLSGTFDVANLTPQSQNYNFYPELFLGPDVTVAWYAATNADFRLVGKMCDTASGQWADISLKNLDQLPAKCLPYLLRSSSDTIAGVWYDAVDSADRVFFGMQGHETQGAGTVIDHMPDAINHFVFGTAREDQLLITWCAETAEEGSQVYFSHGTTPPFDQEIRVSDEGKDYCAHPRLIGLPSNEVAVVWQSSYCDGGDGRILFRELPF